MSGRTSLGRLGVMVCLGMGVGRLAFAAGTPCARVDRADDSARFHCISDGGRRWLVHTALVRVRHGAAARRSGFLSRCGDCHANERFTHHHRSLDSRGKWLERQVSRRRHRRICRVDQLRRARRRCASRLRHSVHGHRPLGRRPDIWARSSGEDCRLGPPLRAPDDRSRKAHRSQPRGPLSGSVRTSTAARPAGIRR